MPLLRWPPTGSNTLHLSKQYNAQPEVRHWGLLEIEQHNTNIEALGWETLECRRHLADATTFYKSINNLIYLPIDGSVRPADPRTRSKHPYKFRHIATNTNAYKYSFFPRTIPLWNNLPTTAVTATGPEGFQVYACLSLEPSATLIDP